MGKDQKDGAGLRIGFFWPEAGVEGRRGQQDVGPGRPVVYPQGPATDHDPLPRETPVMGLDGRVGKGHVDPAEIALLKNGRIQEGTSSKKGFQKREEEDRPSLRQRSGAFSDNPHRGDPSARGPWESPGPERRPV